MTPVTAIAAEAAQPVTHGHLARRGRGRMACSSRQYRNVTIQPARATRSHSLGSLSRFPMRACCARSAFNFSRLLGMCWRLSGLAVAARN